MKIIECKLATDLPTGWMRMLGWTPEEVIEEYKAIYGHEPEVAYLLNKIYYCVD